MEARYGVTAEEWRNGFDIRLLVADTDVSVREVLRYCAKDEGWGLDEAKDGIAALKLLRRNQYNLVILDADLPEVSGELVCGQIRKKSRIPVIFTCNRSSEQDRLECFAAGGNDFVIKPFFPREILARVKSFLDLCGTFSSGKEISSGNPLINTHLHSVMVDDREIKLTPKEYDLLLFFCGHPDRAFSRDDILDYVWGKCFAGTDRTVDTHVKSLRNKIKPYHDYISTIWGYGYKYRT
ncbi:MAG: response regulator transcription factor [Synergistaceae bacterium]|jgi:DNA-binding response OmpR family regulator|nr:response regulator transcription factor [Synergistaceae bacterium]